MANFDIHYHLSYAKMSSFEICPRRYFFSYLLHAPADFTPYYLYLGKIVHRCIAYVETTKKDFEPYLLDLLCQFEFQNDEEIKKVYELSVSLMLMWRYWQRQKRTEKVRFIENPFEIFTGKGVFFKGRIDRIAYDKPTGTWVVTDYKTGKSKVPRKHVISNLQTGGYALALSKMCEDVKKVKVELVYLRDSDTREALIEASQLSQFEEAINEAYEKITSTVSYPAKKSWFCKICRFCELCQKEKNKYKQITPYLKVLTESEKKKDRIEAVSKLADSGTINVVSALCYSLQHDGAAEVRKEAAHALGILADEWTLSLLVRQVPYHSLRHEAHLALGLIADRCSRLSQKARKRVFAAQR